MLHCTNVNELFVPRITMGICLQLKTCTRDDRRVVKQEEVLSPVKRERESTKSCKKRERTSTKSHKKGKEEILCRVRKARKKY